MSKNKQTCGPLYKDGLENFTKMEPSLVRVYAAGFVSGQAEKVYLGACQAAMFRPSEENFEMLYEVVQDVAHRYFLYVELLDTLRGVEIWVCRTISVSRSACNLRLCEENSGMWHRERASLCGIPEIEVDPFFHERNGFGDAGSSGSGGT